MAYINQEMKKKIADLIKPILKEYGVKGSLSLNHHSTVILTIHSGKIDFMGSFKEKGFAPTEPKPTYMNVNPYCFHKQFSGDAKDFLVAACKALKSAGWYDNSDSMADYFDTAYYIHINVGQMDKPYVLQTNNIVEVLN